jgi:hypothetical protein
MSRSQYLCHAWNPADESAPVFETSPDSREHAHTEARRLVLAQPAYAVQVYDRSDLVAEYRGADVAVEISRDIAYMLCDIPVYWPTDDTREDLARLLTYADSGLFTAELAAFSGPAVC